MALHIGGRSQSVRSWPYCEVKPRMLNLIPFLSLSWNVPRVPFIQRAHSSVSVLPMCGLVILL